MAQVQPEQGYSVIFLIGAWVALAAGRLMSQEDRRLMASGFTLGLVPIVVATAALAGMRPENLMGAAEFERAPVQVSLAE